MRHHLLIPGHNDNVDKLSIQSGMRELLACGYNEPKTSMTIQYALHRHARGEEDSARRAAINQNFNGISLTCRLRVLAAARAGAA